MSIYGGAAARVRRRAMVAVVAPSTSARFQRPITCCAVVASAVAAASRTTCVRMRRRRSACDRVIHRVLEARAEDDGVAHAGASGGRRHADRPAWRRVPPCTRSPRSTRARGRAWTRAGHRRRRAEPAAPEDSVARAPRPRCPRRNEGPRRCSPPRRTAPRRAARRRRSYAGRPHRPAAPRASRRA